MFDAGSPPPLFLGDIDNHLIGFQVGLEGIIWRSCRWEIEGGGARPPWTRIQST